MRNWCSLFLVLSCLALLAMLNGCGGGGSAPAADAWTSYDPPATIVPAAARQEYMTGQAFEVLRAVKDVPQDMWLFPNGGVPAIPSFFASTMIPDIEQVAGGLSIGPLAAQPKSFTLKMLEVLKVVAAQKQGAVSPAAASSSVTIDTTDSYGIHWTGTVQSNTTSITGNAHGVGPNTDVAVTFTVSAKVSVVPPGVTGATLSATVKGTCLANVASVDWTTGVSTTSVNSGRAALDATITADATLGAANDTSAGTFTAGTDMSADFEVQNGGSWVLKDRQQTHQAADGSWNASAVALQYTATQYDGATVTDNGVEKLFWGKHQLNGNAGISLTSANITGTLTDHLTLSNGITGILTFDFSSGTGTATVSGTIYAADGTTVLATIGGKLDAAVLADKVAIAWNGGAPEVQTWLY